MFFFIAGVQPRKVRVEDHPRLCPSCGLVRAWLTRQDHYFAAFFIPLFRVKSGETVLLCERCGVVAGDPESRLDQAGAPAAIRCANCGRAMEDGFRFCPYCGGPR